VTRAISTTPKRNLSSSIFFSGRQDAVGNSLRSIKKIRGICSIVNHSEKFGGPVKGVGFSNCFTPRPARLKTVTAPDIIDEIH
jgi:hypothetical protein